MVVIHAMTSLTIAAIGARPFLSAMALGREEGQLDGARRNNKSDRLPMDRIYGPLTTPTEAGIHSPYMYSGDLPRFISPALD